MPENLFLKSHPAWGACGIQSAIAIQSGTGVVVHPQPRADRPALPCAPRIGPPRRRSPGSPDDGTRIALSLRRRLFALAFHRFHDALFERGEKRRTATIVWVRCETFMSRRRPAGFLVKVFVMTCVRIDRMKGTVNTVPPHRSAVGAYDICIRTSYLPGQ